MNKENAKAINDVSKKINSIQQKLDSFFNMLHKQSTDGISENETALFEVAELISDNDAAIMELAEIVGQLAQEV